MHAQASQLVSALGGVTRRRSSSRQQLHGKLLHSGLDGSIRERLVHVEIIGAMSALQQAQQEHSLEGLSALFEHLRTHPEAATAPPM